MTTTGTYAYAPGVGEVALNAFSRIRLRGPMVTAEHIHTASMEANLMQAQWSNEGPNLWAVDKQSIALVQGQGTYSVPPETVMILDVTRSITDTGGNVSEIVMTPVSRSEYMAYPQKMTQGPPSQYWFDRLISPTITLYPVPDAGGPYTLNYYRYRQIQDAAVAGAGNFEIPYLWLDAACAGLAHRLARHYAQDLEAARKADATEAYGIAARQNVDSERMWIVPEVGGYYR
jgi:hypothetical protein